MKKLIFVFLFMLVGCVKKQECELHILPCEYEGNCKAGDTPCPGPEPKKIVK